MDSEKPTEHPYQNEIDRLNEQIGRLEAALSEIKASGREHTLINATSDIARGIRDLKIEKDGFVTKRYVTKQ